VLPRGVLGPGIAQGTFGLFLLPIGRPGCRFTGIADEDPTASGAALFLLPQGRPRPHGAIGTPRFRQNPSASTIETSWEKETLDEEEDNAVEEESV
jgi:hypothetical protein